MITAVDLVARLPTIEQERRLRWLEVQHELRAAELDLIAVASAAATYSYPIPASVLTELRAARGRLDAAVLKLETIRRPP